MDKLNDSYKEIDGQVCVCTQELCEKLGIARKTLTEWEGKGCPKSARGWWPIWELLKWRGLIGNGVKDEEDVAGMSIATKKLKYEMDLKREQAEKAEFANAVIRGEYISKESVTAELQRFFVILKRSMFGYSRKIANELSGIVDSITARKIEKMITELTVDALEQLSIDGVYTATKKKKEKI